MATVKDVAAYILEKSGSMTAMKLQKLCYYSQAWHLVWEDKPLFEDQIEAWANGPVAPVLYRAHRGKFGLQPGEINGDPDSLTPGEAGSVDAVLSFYGDMSAQHLSDQTHSERPWIDAMGGNEKTGWNDKEITHAAMAEFYGSL